MEIKIDTKPVVIKREDGNIHSVQNEVHVNITTSLNEMDFIRKYSKDTFSSLMSSMRHAYAEADRQVQVSV